MRIFLLFFVLLATFACNVLTSRPKLLLRHLCIRFHDRKMICSPCFKKDAEIYRCAEVMLYNEGLTMYCPEFLTHFNVTYDLVESNCGLCRIEESTKCLKEAAFQESVPVTDDQFQCIYDSCQTKIAQLLLVKDVRHQGEKVITFEMAAPLYNTYYLKAKNESVS